MEATLYLVLGMVIGTIGTLIGAGGGFILMPILFLIYPSRPASELTSISLLVVLANAISGTIPYAFKKRIHFKSSLLFSIFTIPGAIAGVFFLDKINISLYHHIFGLFLILSGAYLYIYPDKKEIHSLDLFQGKQINVQLTDTQNNQYNFRYNIFGAILISIIVGFLSSLLGIGGGIIHVPMMIKLLNFPVFIATATSHLTLGVTSLIGSIVHWFKNDIKQADILITLIPGVILGAQIGAKLSDRIKGNLIIRILSISIVLVGIRLLLLKH